MKNFVANGEVVTWTNGGSAVAAGSPVALGDRIGVAVTDIAGGASGAVRVVGIVELTADNTAAFAVGDDLFWDTSALKLYKASGATRIAAGWCVLAKAETATTARVLLGGLTLATATTTRLGAVKQAAAVADLTDNSGGVDPEDGIIAAVTAPTAIDVTNMEDGSANNVLEAITDTSSNDMSGQIERNFDKIADEINVSRDAILALSAAVAQLAAKQNAILAAMRTSGALASA